MNAVIVSNSYSYLERIELLKEYYEEQGYHTVVVMTDFVHIGKKFMPKSAEKDGYVYVKTKPYQKNLSVKRIYSHYIFSKDAFKIIENMQVDVLHVLIPGNTLAKEANQYKIRHPQTKLYIDIIDMWPETLPVESVKKMFPFTYWKNLRDKNLDNTSRVYCECDLYRNVLGKSKDEHFKTVYWAKKEEAIESRPNLSDECISLCYLGSINNIIDIDLIVEICLAIKKHKSVKIHIIGIGERKEYFIQTLKKNNIEVIDYGAVYDEQEKMKVFDVCHFGLNVMKTTVCVGLSMKSLDYFRAQLPVLNTIDGDTTNLVDEYHAGYNDYKKYIDVIDEMTVNDYLDMRFNVKKLYEEKFTKESFFRQLSNNEEE